MAATLNGNVWKVFASVLLVLSVVSGAWALSATVGPARQLEAMDKRVQKCEQSRDELTAFKGTVETDIKYIREALTEIKAKLP